MPCCTAPCRQSFTHLRLRSTAFSRRTRSSKSAQPVALSCLILMNHWGPSVLTLSTSNTSDCGGICVTQLEIPGFRPWPRTRLYCAILHICDSTALILSPGHRVGSSTSQTLASTSHRIPGHTRYGPGNCISPRCGVRQVDLLPFSQERLSTRLCSTRTATTRRKFC